MRNTYWNHKGKFQTAVEKLNGLIPASGPVNPRKLETFRVASNCYYDLYNNGLCNRANEFRSVFGFGGSLYGRRVGRYGLTPIEIKEQNKFEARVEQRMNLIIEAAAKEQNIVL